MPYLYHLVPYGMVGTVLYPLNQLKEVSESAYQLHAKKYRGRETLQETPIPIFDCLWNDVLFLTAVPPATFWKEYESAGLTRLRSPVRHFRFDVQDLELSNLAVMTRMGMDRTYDRFDPSHVDRYANIPQKTYDFWAEELASGEQCPMLYMYIPHILYRGPLDTSLATIVDA